MGYPQNCQATRVHENPAEACIAQRRRSSPNNADGRGVLHAKEVCLLRRLCSVNGELKCGILKGSLLRRHLNGCSLR